MNEFDNIPFSDDNLEQTNSLSGLPFEDPSNNIIILDDRIKDIPPLTKSIEPIITDNNLIIMDDRIKDIPAKNSRVSFKKTSIIFPVFAFAFVSILFMYIFINNSKADTFNLIKIEENKKIGYVDNDGTIVVKPKYTHGSIYHNGLAVVKNDNNLIGILNSKGVSKVPFGTYYSMEFKDDRYIASKITSTGLKYALLDNKLSELTRFEYDNITYSKDGYYSFIFGETLGILDSNGDEVYTFKVDEVDDKKIEIELSDVTNKNSKDRYAKVKVNQSSLIVDLSTGKDVFGYTLEDLYVSSNNVFYLKTENEFGNNTYIVIKDGKVKFKTDKYKLIKVDDVDSDIAICINNDNSVDYINLKDQSVINENKDISYTYGSGLLLENDNGNYRIISLKKELGSFNEYKPISGIYSNKRLAIETEYGKNYLDEKGKVINSKWYEEVVDFNKFGYAKVKENGKYGVINKKGNDIIKANYSDIEFINDKFFNSLKDLLKKEIFIIKDENNKYGLIDNKNNIILENKYDKFEFITDEYSFIIGIIDNNRVLIDLTKMKEIPIEIGNEKIVITQNSIICNNNYYNYEGKLLYKTK